MIEKAKEKKVKNVEFIVGDGENLPFEENSFGIVNNPQNFKTRW